MLKKITAALLVCCTAAVVWAYEPPAAGQLTYQLTTPDVLAGGATVAGGAFAYSAVSQAAVNPAVIASEQRIVLDAAATMLTGTKNGKDNALGLPSIYAGLVIPSKMGVFSASFQQLNAEFDKMALGTTATARGGFAKEMDDNLNVGADLYLSIGKTTAGFDWAFGGDLGFTWYLGTWKYLPFMTDVRWGATLSSLGKNLHTSSTAYSAFPGICTPAVGIAGTLFTFKGISGAAAVDLAVPSFQDIALNTLLDVRVSDFLAVKAGWNLDLLESLNKTASYLPYVSVGVTFGHTSKDDSFLAKMGGQQSEFNLGGAFRQLTNDVTAYSAGATIKVGLPDTTAPSIVLWEDEE